MESGVDDLEVRVRKVVEVNAIDGGAEIDIAFGSMIHGDHFNVFDQ